MSNTLDRHREALDRDPTNAHAFEALEEHYFVQGQWSELVDLYRERMAAPDMSEDPQRQLRMLFRLGQVLQERCGEIDEAVEVYRRAAQIDPGFRPALRQLRRIHANRGQWDLVLQIAELEGRVKMSAHERSSFLAEMGYVWMDHLDDTGEALDCFEHALEANSDEQEALRGMALCQQTLGRAERAAGFWQRLVERQRGPERAPALVTLGRLYWGPLAQPERAGECFRQAMSDDPRNEAAVECLSTIAAAREQWALVGELYDRRFQLAAGARRRSAIALEAGHMQLERFGDAAAAQAWFERARVLIDDDVAIHHSLAEAARKAGDADALQQALERVVEIAGAEAPMSVLLETADLHAESGDDERALQCLRWAHARRPEDPLVLEALSDTLSRAGRTSELIEVLESRTEILVNDPHTYAEAQCELARVYERDLGDGDAAIGALQQALRADANSEEAIRRLERLYPKAERWTELRQLLERARESGSEARRAERCAALGVLLRDRFDERDDALQAFEQALERQPDNRIALHGMEGIARESGDTETLLRFCEREIAIATDPERQCQLCAELAGLYEQRGESEQALVFAQRQLETSREARPVLERIARLQRELGHEQELRGTLERLDPLLRDALQAANRRELADLYERAGEMDRATASLEAVLESQPGNRAALEALADRYRATRRPDELARSLRRLAEVVPDKRRDGCLVELAGLLEDPIGDLDAAVVVYWRLCARPDAEPTICKRLENLLERAGRFEELAQLLQERRHALGDRDEQIPALELRHARLLMDRLGQAEEAIELFRSVLERDPRSRAASEGLESALRASNDFAALARLLKRRAREESDPRERSRIEMERAVLLEEALGDHETARRLYATLCKDSADDALAAEANQRLDRLLERHGQWGALRERLEAALRHEPNGGGARLHERLADLCRNRLHDNEGAIAHLEALGRIEPACVAAWRLLARLYQQSGQGRDQLRVIEAELATQPPKGREQLLRTRAARLEIELEPDPAWLERARAHCERVLELDPTDSDAIDFLIWNYEDAGRTRDVVRLLEHCLEATVGADVAAAEKRTALRLRKAGLLADELDELEEAIATLEEARDEIGSPGVIAAPLADLCERAGDDERLRCICRAAGDAADCPASRASWRGREAGVLRRLARPDEAVDVYREALADRPGDVEIEATLRDLYRELRRADPLAELLQAGIEHASVGERLPMRIELAGLLADELDRPEEALEQALAVFSERPEERVAFDLATELSQRLHRPEVALELLDAQLARGGAAGDDGQLCAWYEKRGELLLGPLQRPERAVAAYREALAIDPDRRSARSALRLALERLGRWRSALDCLYVEVESAPPEERPVLIERGLALAAEHLSSDARLPWLERLRAERPNDADVLARIGDIHREAGRPEALLRALEAELELRADEASRRTLLLERARILETDLDSPGRAIAAYEAVRQLAPRDYETLVALDRLYERNGHARERASILALRIEVEPPEAQIDLRCRAARIHFDELAEPQVAAVHLAHALATHRECHGRDRIALDLLRELGDCLHATDSVDGWLRAAEEELATVDELGLLDDKAQRRRAQLHFEMARVYYDDLALPDTACRHLRALLDPTEQGASPSLSPGRRRWAEQTLIERLRATDNPCELARRLEKRLSDGAGESLEWLELARLYEERLHRPGAAARAYQQRLQDDSGCANAIRGLQRVSQILGDWEELAHGLELELDTLDSNASARRMALQRRLGDLCRHRLHEPERAERAYRAALDCTPTDLESLHALQGLLEDSGRWSDAVDATRREIEILDEIGIENEDEDKDEDKDEGEGNQRHKYRHQYRHQCRHQYRHQCRHAWKLWLHIGEIARERMADRLQAISAWESAAAIEPLPLEHLRALAELYRAGGDLESYIETFGRWCDDPQSGAGARDELALCAALEERGHSRDALERARRAVSLDEAHAEGWRCVARLAEQHLEVGEACHAWLAAAQCSEPDEAARALLSAARIAESSDASEALRHLREACWRDPGMATAHAERARLAQAQGKLDEAEEAAASALALAGADAEDPATSKLDAGKRLEAALAGGRAARTRKRMEQASGFFAEALALDPRHVEALTAHAELLFESGDFEAARELLERRLALPADDSQRARQLAMFARTLECAGELEPAVARYLEAVELDSQLAPANEGLIGLYEESGQCDRAASALESWLRNDPDASSRARSHSRLAQHQLATECFADAESQLREAVIDDPDQSLAWALLVELLEERSPEEALAIGEQALEHLEPGVERARVSVVRARVLAASERNSEAARAWGEAARCDPRHAQPALEEARLLRMMGDWYASAKALAHFIEAYPNPDGVELARLHLERARLMAGPLENVEQAIADYQRALELDPELRAAREPLAALLAHVPERWRDAVSSHRELLEEDPTRLASLRSLLEIARRRDDTRAVDAGLSVLRALGFLTPHEAGEAPDSLPIPLEPTLQQDDPAWESARRICNAAAQEIADVLENTPSAEPTPADETGPLAAMSRSVRRFEDELSAPGLCALPTESISSLVYTVAALAADPGGNCREGPYLLAFDRALGRWSRRRVRKALGRHGVLDIETIDFGAWRQSVRLLASCLALDESGGNLRSALLMWVQDAQPEGEPVPGPDADIGCLVADCAPARSLLWRVVRRWCDALCEG